MHIVLAFPKKLAATTFPLLPLIILQESTIISLVTITTGTTIGINRSYARIINKPLTITGRLIVNGP